MKKCTLILAIFTFSFQMANAQWWDSNKKIKGNGEQTTQNRSVSEYDQVSLQGFMDVELVSGREGELQVEELNNRPSVDREYLMQFWERMRGEK